MSDTPYYMLPKSARMLLDECIGRLRNARTSAATADDATAGLLQHCLTDLTTPPLLLLESMMLRSAMLAFIGGSATYQLTEADLERIAPAQFSHLNQTPLIELFEKLRVALAGQSTKVSPSSIVRSALLDYLFQVLGAELHECSARAESRTRSSSLELAHLGHRLRSVQYARDFRHFGSWDLPFMIDWAYYTAEAGALEAAELFTRAGLVAAGPENRREIARAHLLQCWIALKQRDQVKAALALGQGLGAACDEETLQLPLRFSIEGGGPNYDESWIRGLLPENRREFMQRVRSGVYSPNPELARDLRDQADIAWQDWLTAQLASGATASSPTLALHTGKQLEQWRLAWNAFMGIVADRMEAQRLADEGLAMCERHPEFHPAIRAEFEIWKDLTITEVPASLKLFKPMSQLAEADELRWGFSQENGTADLTALASAGVLFRRILHVSRWIFGADSWEIAGPWVSVARCCDHAGLFRAADAHFEEILSLMHDSDRPVHAWLYFDFAQHLILGSRAFAQSRVRGEETEAAGYLPMETLGREDPALWTKRGLAVAAPENPKIPFACAWLRRSGVTETELQRVLGAVHRSREGDPEAEQVLRELSLDGGGFPWYSRALARLIRDRSGHASPWETPPIQKAELEWSLWLNQTGFTALGTSPGDLAGLSRKVRWALGSARNQLRESYDLAERAADQADDYARTLSADIPVDGDFFRWIEAKGYQILTRRELRAWRPLVKVATAILPCSTQLQAQGIPPAALGDSLTHWSAMLDREDRAANEYERAGTEVAHYALPAVNALMRLEANRRDLDDVLPGNQPEENFDRFFRLFRFNCLSGAYLFVQGPSDHPATIPGTLLDAFYYDITQLALRGALLGHHRRALGLCLTSIRLTQTAARPPLAVVHHAAAQISEQLGDAVGALLCYQQAAKVLRDTSGSNRGQLYEPCLEAIARLGGDSTTFNHVEYNFWLRLHRSNWGWLPNLAGNRPTAIILRPARRLWEAVFPPPNEDDNEAPDSLSETEYLLTRRQRRAEIAETSARDALQELLSIGAGDQLMIAELYLLQAEAFRMLRELNESKRHGLQSLHSLRSAHRHELQQALEAWQGSTTHLGQALQRDCDGFTRLLQREFDGDPGLIHPDADWQVLAVALAALTGIFGSLASGAGDNTRYCSHKERQFALALIFGSGIFTDTAAEAATSLAAAHVEEGRHHDGRKWLRRVLNADWWEPQGLVEAYEVAEDLEDETIMREIVELLADLTSRAKPDHRYGEAYSAVQGAFAKYLDQATGAIGLLDASEETLEALRVSDPARWIAVRCARLLLEGKEAEAQELGRRELIPFFEATKFDAWDSSESDSLKAQLLTWAKSARRAIMFAFLGLDEEASSLLDHADMVLPGGQRALGIDVAKAERSTQATRLRISLSLGEGTVHDPLWANALSRALKQSDACLAAGSLFDRRARMATLQKLRGQFLARAAKQGTGEAVTQALDFLLATSGTLDEVILRERELLRATGFTEAKQLLRDEEALLEHLVAHPEKAEILIQGRGFIPRELLLEELALIGSELSLLAQQLSPESLLPPRIRSSDLREALGEATLLHFVRYPLPLDSLKARLATRHEGRSPERYGALILRADAPPVMIELPTAAAELDEAIRMWDTLLAGYQVLDAEAQAEVVDTQLLRPLVDHLPPGLIYVVPAGSLHTISFATLRFNTDPVPQSLRIWDYTFAYLIHARELLSLKALTPATGPAVVMGVNDFDPVAPEAPAPDTGPDELAQIMDMEGYDAPLSDPPLEAMLPMRATDQVYRLRQLEHAEDEAAFVAERLMLSPALGPKAIAQIVRDLRVPPTLFHAAVHGLFRSLAIGEEDLDSPVSFFVPLLACELAFAGANDPTQRGTAYITGLHLARLPLTGCQLFVLSACESAQGVVTRDGVLGFRQATAAAGARSSICALYEIDDFKTLQMMRWFYEALANNRSPAAALREAQLRALEDRGNAWRDYEWGAFVAGGYQEPLAIFDLTGEAAEDPL